MFFLGLTSKSQVQATASECLRSFQSFVDGFRINWIDFFFSLHLFLPAIPMRKKMSETFSMSGSLVHFFVSYVSVCYRHKSSCSPFIRHIAACLPGLYGAAPPFRFELDPSYVQLGTNPSLSKMEFYQSEKQNKTCWRGVTRRVEKLRNTCRQ